MEKKQNKVIGFVKNHKKEIVLGTITAVVAIGGIVLIAMGKKKPTDPGCWFAGAVHTPAVKDIKIDGWGLGTLHECWLEGDGVMAIADGMTVADAGKLGEELLKVDGVNPDSGLSVILGVCTDFKVN